MKLLYRYIMSKFWGPFFFGLGIFAVLVFLADLFDHLKYFTKTEAPLGIILKYFVLIIPFWTFTIVPVAALLAALFVLSELIASGEWVAAMASGYRPRQLYAPVVLCAAIVASVNFGLQEFISPRIHRRADTLFERDIKGVPNWEQFSKDNVVVKVGENIMLSAKRLDTRAGTMERVVMDITMRGKIISQLDAEGAVWDRRSERWIFSRGVKRDFLKENKIKEVVFEEYISNISISPRRMIIEKVWPEDLTIRDLVSRIDLLQKTGSPAHRDRVYLHAKIAAPFAAVVICLLGIPFVLVVKKGNKMIYFASAMIITFVFWWAMSISQSAGEAGMLNPAAAAWGPIILFGAAGLTGLKYSE